jgi:hypothetical protein
MNVWRRVIIILIFAFLIYPRSALARGHGGSHYRSSGNVRVKGYSRRNGAYIQPHYRTKTNRTRFDNYSTKGNVNPYTGKGGTKNP